MTTPYERFLAATNDDSPIPQAAQAEYVEALLSRGRERARPGRSVAATSPAEQHCPNCLVATHDGFCDCCGMQRRETTAPRSSVESGQA